MDIFQLYYFVRGMVFMFVLLACIFFLRKQERLKQVLGYVLLFWLFTGVKGMAFIFPAVRASDYWTMLLFSIDMMAIPTCAFFLMEMFRPYSVTKKVVLLHELPYLATFAVCAATGHDWAFYFSAAYSLVYGTVIVFAIRRFIHRYQRTVLDNYSNIDRLNVRWLRHTTLIFFGFLLVYMLACLVNRPWLDIIYYVVMMGLWADVCYYVNRQDDLSRQLLDEDEQIENMAVQEPECEDSAVEALAEKLENTMRESKLYLNPQLSLSDLSQIVGTNRTYLSQYLNRVLGTTFYDYVNEYRLNASLELLAESGKPLLVVAEESGFNSLSTFRRSFVKKYECTPSEYRERESRNSEDESSAAAC